MIRQGSGEPLVLLHGILCSERVWADVIPHLAPHNDVIALTALGHRGGRPVPDKTSFQRGTGFSDIVDDAEASLDDLGIQQAHLAGNSMGGWVALELARRGRAISVCALSPAGCWDVSQGGQLHALSTLHSLVKLTQRTRWAIPTLSKIALVRRLAMQVNAVRGNHITSQQFINMADDLLGCTVRDSLLSSREQLTTMDPLPCPVTLAWSECDEIFPPKINGSQARQLFPQAEWRLLPNVGHLPMADDPQLVAEVILGSIKRSA